MLQFTDLTEVVLRAADAADAVKKAHVAAGGQICCVCAALLVGRDLCPAHFDDHQLESEAQTDVGRRLDRVADVAMRVLGLERPR